jgi:nitric oxide reductase NorD protein
MTRLAAQTRRVFELLCPQWAKEKRLPDGDTIDIDRLVGYQVLRRREPSPKVDFFQKPLRRQRDLAALILLDVSGSTGQDGARGRTIEVEKHAALILGQGLSVLDDRFAVCGFSGTGREHCEFYIYKDFDERWDRETIARVLSAYPRSATRIGAALRHAGYRLSLVSARQRLIIAMTDGKPTDTDYDPSTRYAQHDVRMACVENRRRGIHTFCVSTLENSRADMEIMFPGQMFAILPDIRQLPRVLPRLYIRMTT